MDLDNKSISLVGYGKSNASLCSFLMKRGITPIVRNQRKIPVPDGVSLITEDYLSTSEDLVFRSPVIHPSRIIARGKITSELELALALTRGYKIGVSGSDGKTTTSTLISEILKRAGKKTSLCGNIGIPAIELAELSTDDSYTVCEMSSFQLYDMKPQLDIAVITGISENHLDWHSDMQDYIDAKKNILTNAKGLVLSYDNEITRSLYDGKREVVFFTKNRIPRNAPKNAKFVHIENGVICYEGKGIIEADSLRLRGEFNLLNFECAIACTHDIVSTDVIAEVARDFSGVDCRMQTIKEVGGVSFVDSSIDSTPSRTIATISAFEMSKIVLLLGGYDKGLSYAPLKNALKGIKCAVLCGANSTKIYNEIKDICKIRHAKDLENAVKIAYSESSLGDYVIIP